MYLVILVSQATGGSMYQGWSHYYTWRLDVDFLWLPLGFVTSGRQRLGTRGSVEALMGDLDTKLRGLLVLIQ